MQGQNKQWVKYYNLIYSYIQTFTVATRSGLMLTKTTFLTAYFTSGQEKKRHTTIEEDGFDPSTLWAQHTPTAPLCYLELPSFSS